MMEAGLLSAFDAKDVAEAIASTFPGWRVCRDEHGWHAVRRGNFREDQLDPDGAAVYSLHSADPLVLVLQLHGQEQIAPAPPRQLPRQEPIERARDEIARGIEGRHPGVRVTHDLYGWTATFADGEAVRAQSHVALEALLPFSGG